MSSASDWLKVQLGKMRGRWEAGWTVLLVCEADVSAVAPELNDIGWQQVESCAKRLLELDRTAGITEIWLGSSHLTAAVTAEGISAKLSTGRPIHRWWKEPERPHYVGGINYLAETLRARGPNGVIVLVAPWQYIQELLRASGVKIPGIARVISPEYVYPVAITAGGRIKKSPLYGEIRSFGC